MALQRCGEIFQADHSWDLQHRTVERRTVACLAASRGGHPGDSGMMVKTPSVLNAFQAGAPAPSKSGVKRRKLCQWHNAGVSFLPLHLVAGWLRLSRLFALCRTVPGTNGSLQAQSATRSAGARKDVQPFSQKSRTPTVAKEFQIGLYDPAEADLELFCNSWSAGFLGERLYALGCRCAAVLAPSVSLRRPVTFDRDCHRRSAGCWRPLHSEIRNPPPCWYSIKNGRTTLFLLPEGPMIDTMGPVAHKSGGHWRGSRSCTAAAIPPNGCWSRQQSERFARAVAGRPCRASSSTRQHNDAVAPRREPPYQEHPS